MQESGREVGQSGLEMPACGIGKHGMMRHPAEYLSSSIEGFYKPYTGMPYPRFGTADTPSTWLHPVPFCENGFRGEIQHFRRLDLHRK